MSNIANNNAAQPIFPTYPSIPIVFPDTNSTACQTVCYNEGICNITQCQVNILNDLNDRVQSSWIFLTYKNMWKVCASPVQMGNSANVFSDAGYHWPIVLFQSIGAFHKIGFTIQLLDWKSILRIIRFHCQDDPEFSRLKSQCLADGNWDLPPRCIIRRSRNKLKE